MACAIHMDRGNRQWFFQSWPVLTSILVWKYLPKSVATVQGNLNQAIKIQDQHNYKSQWIPAMQKLIFYLKQLWMQVKYNHTKQVVFQSHPEREWSMYLSYNYTILKQFFRFHQNQNRKRHPTVIHNMSWIPQQERIQAKNKLVVQWSIQWPKEIQSGLGNISPDSSNRGA